MIRELLLALGVGVACGCQLIGGFEQFSEEPRAAAGAAQLTAGAGGTAACGTEAPGLHGPPMARVPRSADDCFWMDRTEVTVAQYAEFLQAAPSIQNPVCAWNEPGESSAGGAAGYEPAADCALDDSDANLPMTCVDWCDAFAYCVWAGKELCGDDGDFPRREDSDWYAACTSAGAGGPYGCDDCESGDACNGAGSGLGAVQPVASLPGCSKTTGDAEPIFDLSGNAAEWTAWCSPTTANGDCSLRGGHFSSPDSQLQCESVQRTPRKSAFATLGFRCCSQQH